jgi:serine phosphatase RsbU (regulator of sigma subunit)
MRTASEFLTSPADLLSQVDRTLKHRPTLSVCTALCLRLEDDRATIAVGGHPLPLYMAGELITKVGAHGPLLGAFEQAKWQDVTIELEPGSTLLAYTDGITDAVDAERSRFGLERLHDALRDLAGRPAAEIVERLTGALANFQTGAHADDTAAIVLQRLAHAGGPGDVASHHDDRLAAARHGQTH